MGELAGIISNRESAANPSSTFSGSMRLKERITSTLEIAEVFTGASRNSAKEIDSFSEISNLRIAELSIYQLNI